MTEKRFKGYAEKTGQHHILIINDEIGEEYSLTDDFFKSKDVLFEIVDLLNVMNDTLLKQAKENHKLSNENIEQQTTINKLNDENNLLQEVLSENEKMLGKDLDMLTKLRKENKKKDIEIKSLNAHITNWLDETKIAKLYQNEQYKTENLEKEVKQLRKELKEIKENPINYF